MSENIIDNIDEMDVVSNVETNMVNITTNLNNNPMDILKDEDEILDETIFAGFTPITSTNILEEDVINDNPQENVNKIENVDKVLNPTILNDLDDVDVIMPSVITEQPVIKEAIIDSLEFPKFEELGKEEETLITPDIENKEEVIIDTLPKEDVSVDNTLENNDIEFTLDEELDDTLITNDELSEKVSLITDNSSLEENKVEANEVSNEVINNEVQNNESSKEDEVEVKNVNQSQVTEEDNTSKEEVNTPNMFIPIADNSSLEENKVEANEVSNEVVNNEVQSNESSKEEKTESEEEKVKEEVNTPNMFIPIADNSSLEENKAENSEISNEVVNNEVQSNESSKEEVEGKNVIQSQVTKEDNTEENKDENVENTESPKGDTLLEKYGENFSIKKYVCNPAIGRESEIKQLILTLLTPEKSGILVGKPGIGKTAIVEGLGYQIQMGNVPDALKEYQIYKLNTSSLLGIMPGTNEPKIQVLLNEIKGQTKLILFIDEIHTLIGAGSTGDDSLDFANIFKPGLDRGNIKIIGATTSDEYDRYILTDKAFVRRFQKIEVAEPTKEHTIKILMGSLPKLEHKTGAKLKYTPFVQEQIMTFIVELTSEYRRVYELSARYPDVSLTILQQAFSYAVFDNKKEVSIRDIRKAINNTKLVYSDVIKKELIRFNEIFADIYRMETIQRLKGETSL